MTLRTPLDTARILAAEYGQQLDPVNYIVGVAISGRLRLHAALPSTPNPAPGIVDAVDPLVTPDNLAQVRDADGSVQSGFVWAGELSAATGDDRYANFLIGIADRYLDIRPDGLPHPIDPDNRVEEVFFAGALLGRAFQRTADPRYANALAAILGRVHAQPDSGLWWHCGASPFYWGRGNAFAALGFAEALSYLPHDHPQRHALLAEHRAHLNVLLRHQHDTGAWHQVVDRPDSYLELTATAMIGYALARGIGRGWLPSDSGANYRPAVDRAWAAVNERVDDAGMVRDACVGTGPLPTLDDYLQRPAATGHDDRASSMALWFALEYAALTHAGA